MQDYPYPESKAVRGIGGSIFLTFITFGIYMLYWQGKQIAMLNAWLGRKEFSLWRWFFFSIFTIGIYALFHAYKTASGINQVRADNGMWVDASLPAVCILMTIFGFGISSIAIQQGWINRIYKGL